MLIEELRDIAIRNSSYVENVLRHNLLSGLLSLAWQTSPNTKLQIYTGEVDDVGSDIVLTFGKVTWHIQLKGANTKATKTEVEVNVALATAPSGCVVWMVYDLSDLSIRKFLFFGNRPGAPLPELTKYKIARRATHNSKGERPRRPNIRCVPKSSFVAAGDYSELAKLLFGAPFSTSATNKSAP